MLAWIVLGSLVFGLSGSGPAWADDVRHSGNVHSFTPAEGVLVIEAIGADGAEETVWADVRDAEIVRLARHPRRPWEWREQRTGAHWLSSGTYVTVIGRERRSGIVRASRVEVPEPDDPQ
ncbi:MAG TPA: hypothetical protein VGB86_13115 [Methylomirabilota bacterium]|jgi:hypothetical protein